MLRKVIEYTDYNDQVRTEPFYFSLTKADLIKFMLNHGFDFGTSKITRFMERADSRELFDFIDDLVKASYGVKSDDGKSFVKDAATLAEFLYSPAYSELIMEFMTKPNAIDEFFAGVIPAGMMEETQRELEKSDFSNVPEEIRDQVKEHILKKA